MMSLRRPTATAKNHHRPTLHLRLQIHTQSGESDRPLPCSVTPVKFSFGHCITLSFHKLFLFQFLAEMLSPRGQSGLEAKILASASVSASKLWPRPRPWPQTFGLGLASVCSRRTNSQEEMDGPICLYFTLPTTRHHTMIEDSYCARENEK